MKRINTAESCGDLKYQKSTSCYLIIQVNSSEIKQNPAAKTNLQRKLTIIYGDASNNYNEQAKIYLWLQVQEVTI